MACPSLSLITPRGWPAVLVTSGLLKIGCLRTSAWEVSSVFTRLALTFNQDPRILFQKEHVVFWNLGAAKNQLMSWFLGPLLWTGSWIWSMRCLRISFQGSPLGDSPHTRSLASRVSDWALGSMIPRPPLDRGSMKESHLTFA